MSAGRLGDGPDLPAQPVTPVVPAPTGTTGPAAGGSSVAVALYDIDPDTVSALVRSCKAVAGLSGGPFGAAATYLPGRRVAGVQISTGAVEVHVVGRYGIPVSELADQVRRVLSGKVLGRKVDIVVEDITDPRSPSAVVPAAAPPANAPPVSPVAQAAHPSVGWPPATLPPPPAPR